MKTMQLFLYLLFTSSLLIISSCEDEEDITFKNQLNPTESLTTGEKLVSESKNFSLTLEENGNLVIQDANGLAIWNTNTGGQPAQMLTMQENGNLVLLDIQGNVIWASETQGFPDAFLIMQDDGNLVIYHETIPIWSSKEGLLITYPDRLFPSESLQRGEKLVSENGLFELVFLENGNIGVSSGETVIWETNIDDAFAEKLLMQDDGNLVLYAEDGTVVWESGTSGHPGAYLWMQDNGNLVIYENEIPLWSANEGLILPEPVSLENTRWKLVKIWNADRVLFDNLNSIQSIIFKNGNYTFKFNCYCSSIGQYSIQAELLHLDTEGKSVCTRLPCETESDKVSFLRNFRKGAYKYSIMEETLILQDLTNSNYFQFHM